MKKITTTAALALGICMSLTSCFNHGHHTTMEINDGQHKMRIEYQGRIVFNDDNTAIESISPGGYVKYKNDDRKMEAKNNDHGKIIYELYDGDSQLGMDSSGRKLISEAVREMTKKRK